MVVWTLWIMDRPIRLHLHPLPTAEVSLQSKQNYSNFLWIFFFRGSDFERRSLVSKTKFPSSTELFCEPTPVQFLQLVLNKCITLWKWDRPLFSKYICGVNIFCIFFLNSFFFKNFISHSPKIGEMYSVQLSSCSRGNLCLFSNFLLSFLYLNQFFLLEDL